MSGTAAAAVAQRPAAQVGQMARDYTSEQLSSDEGATVRSLLDSWDRQVQAVAVPVTVRSRSGLSVSGFSRLEGAPGRGYLVDRGSCSFARSAGTTCRLFSLQLQRWTGDGGFLTRAGPGGDLRSVKKPP